MFAEQIEKIWSRWFYKEKPSKLSPIIYLCALLCVVWCIMGIFVYIRSAEIVGGMIFGSGMVLLMIVACKISEKQASMVKSAVEFCWRNQIYDVGKNMEFPFLHTNAQYIIGGKTFEYINERVIFYDTYYASQYNSPGMVVEITPLYSIGSGVPVWKKGRAIVPDQIGLSDNCIQCIEEIMNYEYHHGVIKPGCYRDGDKFYFYVVGTAMGLIVDESGGLFPKTAIAPDGLWVGADSLLNILEKNLGKKEGNKYD